VKKLVSQIYESMLDVLAQIIVIRIVALYIFDKKGKRL